MKRIILLTFVLILLLPVLTSAQSDYTFEGRYEVGIQPVAVYNTNIGPVVYCAGRDMNYNGIKDSGDVSPSLWSVEIMQLTKYISSEQQFGIARTKKLTDLEFKMPVLPVRNFWDEKEKKLYITNEKSISAVSFIQLDSVYIETIVDVTASAVSSKDNFLYISVRPSYTDPGNVLVYDKIKKVYSDTIPAGISVQQTIPTIDNKLFILSEGVYGSTGGKVQIFDISGSKPNLIKDLVVSGTPTHLEYNGNLFITCNASNQVKKLNLEDYSMDSLTITLAAYDGPRETCFPLGDEFKYTGITLTSAYDGNIYMFDAQSKKELYRYDCKAKPEGFLGVYGVLIIATPYLDSTYTLDSNITIYALPMDVAENPAQEGYYVYPNPAEGLISIKTPDEFDLSTAILYNSMGVKISNLLISGESKNISLKDLGLRPGAYFVKVSDGRKNLTLPFVVR